MPYGVGFPFFVGDASSTVTSVSSAVYIREVAVLSPTCSRDELQGQAHSFKSDPTINSSGVGVFKLLDGTYTVPALYFVPPRGIFAFLFTA